MRRDRPWAVLSVLCAGFFVTLLDTSIVNVAIPRVRADLDAGLDQVLWVVNGYLLAFAVPLITAGRLGDRFGPRRVYLAGLSLFTLASALCGAAPGIDALIAARVLSGVGAALLGPQTFAFITILFPPSRRGAALGVWGAVAGLATATGPLVGGLVVGALGWRWVFLINVPVGILGVVLAALLAPDSRPGARHRFDVPGTVVISLALLAISFGLLEGQRYRWGPVAGPVSIPALLVVGTLLLGLFVLLQRAGTREPLVPPALFASRNFTLASAVMLCFGFAMAGLALPLTLYLQDGLGLGPAAAGGVLAVASLASGLVAPFAGRAAARVGRIALLAGGLLAYAVGLSLVAASAQGAAGPWPLVPPLLLTGAGIGCVFMLVAELAVGDLPPHLAGAASGVFNTTRQVGGVFGAAAIGALLQDRVAATGELARALRETTVLPVAVTLIGLACVVVPMYLSRSGKPARHSDKYGVGIGRGNAVRR
ncbi:DHA2 family efflux MFS transporter permease subunit [Mangrovihabitans endophyticus]|uniref:MFS transporter n=1 Tax=Mangrovihabitans endophyticus TaxID=1751298 RepID=A0A8J3BW58_9ACTN|nr:DHA2 family efflux MFS transporter permease subunit [Mangrovihabitans endophyticus]GGK74097.1 MFS transporter [Mangrovihabitans endophyticus]